MRLIDADKLQEFPIRANRCDKEHANTHFINGIETVFEYAEQLPTVDEEVVVRCKDCKHHYWEQEPCHGKSVHYCKIPHMRGVEVFKEFFCYYGERKEG